MTVKKPAGKWEDHPTGSYGVNRKFTKLADGTNKMTGMSATCPVNICGYCHRVVDKLYPISHGSFVKVYSKACRDCKEKFEKCQ